MKVLIIINDAPYGTEKAYNALRMAMALQKHHSDVKVRVFLLADSVGCAVAGQETPRGYYNIERMLKSIIANDGEVKTCGTCLDARGLTQVALAQGAERSNMQEFSDWVVDADKIMTF